VGQDVKDFKNKTNSFQDYFEMSTLLIPSSAVRAIKHRIKDSANKRGSSSGFRLIFIANSKTQTITFCHVYPKIGPLGKKSASKGEVSEIIGEYLAQFKSKSLVPYPKD
jgi:mRNA-degrading endonuclease RelE of RelBE toxin-antitoxin system